MTRSDVWDNSQIIFVRPGSEPQPSADPTTSELVTFLDDISGDFLALLDGACVLGMRNPFAEGLFLEGEGGSFAVDKSLKDADMFMGAFAELCEDVELFREKLHKVAYELEMYRADALARATEEPKDAEGRIQALQYALEQEKAWNERLAEERDELKAQLSSISANPLSQSIDLALRPKRTPRS